MAIPKLLEPGKIGSMIETVFATDAQFAGLLHEVTFQCAAHCEKHGDYTLVARLLGGNVKNKKGEVVESFPVTLKAVSRREITLWLIRYTPIRFRDGAWLVSKAKDAGWNLAEGYANPWHSLPEVQADRNREITFDNIQNVIFGSEQRLRNAIAKGAFKGDPVATLAYIKAVKEVPVPKTVAKRVIEPDFKSHDEPEVVAILAKGASALAKDEKLGDGVKEVGSPQPKAA